jgi:hydrogenase-4 component E
MSLKPGVDLLLSVIGLGNLALAGLGAMSTGNRILALQGWLLGLLVLSVRSEELWLHGALLAVGIVALKGVLFPRLLTRAIRESGVSRESRPMVGYGLSLVVATLGLPVAMWISACLPDVARPVGSFAIPVAFHAILVGLFLIVSRRIAVMQVLGYLVLENGIFILGISLVQEQALLVELGILLDVFVAVFVMGITVFHISREFEHVETDRLSSLRG